MKIYISLNSNNPNKLLGKRHVGGTPVHGTEYPDVAAQHETRSASYSARRRSGVRNTYTKSYLYLEIWLKLSEFTNI